MTRNGGSPVLRLVLFTRKRARTRIHTNTLHRCRRRGADGLPDIRVTSIATDVHTEHIAVRNILRSRRHDRRAPFISWWWPVVTCHGLYASGIGAACGPGIARQTFRQPNRDTDQFGRYQRNFEMERHEHAGSATPGRSGFLDMSLVHRPPAEIRNLAKANSHADKTCRDMAVCAWKWKIFPPFRHLRRYLDSYHMIVSQEYFASEVARLASSIIFLFRQRGSHVSSWCVKRRCRRDGRASRGSFRDQ